MGVYGNVQPMQMNYADFEYCVLDNATGTTVVHANTSGSRFAFMGFQGATNNTGATVQVQQVGSGTALTGAIPSVANTCISGFQVTGFPYNISADDMGMQFTVSAGNAFDGVLQFMEIPNA